MKNDRLHYPVVPIIVIIIVSLTSIVFGIYPYIKKDFIGKIDIMQYTLIGCGAVCFLTSLMILLNTVKIQKKDMLVGEKEKEASVKAAPPPYQKSDKKDNDQAVLLLSLLQEKGRFLDFIMEDIASYSDEQIGAASRVVHQGCNELIKYCFNPEAISTAKENNEVTLNDGYNTREYKIVGDVNGDPPYNGKLIHKGWRANQVKLPQLSLPRSQSDTPVIQPAEIEL